MARTRLIFYGTEDSATSEIECYLNSNNEIFIKLREEGFPIRFITFDKSTAIKFAKTLRTEINKIQEGGSNE
tara:strand:+ start:190 stop:405 length:216 start_codon:yes stop_codon:yes gene_type:complete